MKSSEEIFAQNIRLFRRKINLTQERLAEKIGYSKKTVSKWELGKSVPNISTIILLAKIFGTDVNELVGYTKEPLYFLGIDGGATKTEFMVCDAYGNIKKRHPKMLRVDKEVIPKTIP